MPAKLTIWNKRMLMLMDSLKKNKIIRFNSDFSTELGMPRQNLRNIKLGTQSFTIEQIQRACIVYDVDANWILGINKTSDLSEQKKTVLTLIPKRK